MGGLSNTAQEAGLVGGQVGWASGRGAGEDRGVGQGAGGGLGRRTVQRRDRRPLPRRKKVQGGKREERSKKTRKLRRTGFCLVWLIEVEEKAV